MITKVILYIKALVSCTVGRSVLKGVYRTNARQDCKSCRHDMQYICDTSPKETVGMTELHYAQGVR